MPVTFDAIQADIDWANPDGSRARAHQSVSGQPNPCLREPEVMRWFGPPLPLCPRGNASAEQSVQPVPLKTHDGRTRQQSAGPRRLKHPPPGPPAAWTTARPVALTHRPTRRPNRPPQSVSSQQPATRSVRFDQGRQADAISPAEPTDLVEPSEQSQRSHCQVQRNHFGNREARRDSRASATPGRDPVPSLAVYPAACSCSTGPGAGWLVLQA